MTIPFRLSCLALCLAGTFAQAAPDTWEGSGPNAAGTSSWTINALAVSPDGQTVYAGSASGRVLHYLIGDTLPAAFSFSAQSNVARSTVVVSNAITVAGINTATAISISGGEYEINGSGIWTTANGSVNPNDSVKLRHTSSAAYNTATTTTLTIGGVAASFSSTTLALAGGCGSANGVATAFTPATHLCSAGAASAVTAASAWNWSCTADTVASCSAPNQATATGNGNGRATISGGGVGTWAVDTGAVGGVPKSAGFIASRGDPSGKSPPDTPPGYYFPYGLFDFTLSGGGNGSTATLVVSYPGAVPPNAVYWKYGPSPAGYQCSGAACATPHWYPMPAAQAVIAGNTITLTIVDGGVGDDDLTANGTIIDAGGPGVPGVADIPTLSEWGVLLLSGLMAWLGLAAVPRRAVPPCPGQR